MKTVKFRFIGYEIDKDIWYSKNSLFENFFGDFYAFLINNGAIELLKENHIESLENFLNKASLWEEGASDNFYDFAFKFHNYFATPNGDYQIKNQPTDTFIGYLYQNNKYRIFLTFLMSFFPYWRNDEGCTKFNPYNKCDNPFVSSWALLVDTLKLFAFSSETVYWWQSFRVKYCLDHIPGVLLSKYEKEIAFEESLDLPNIHIAGYKFEGWHLEDDINSKKVHKVSENTIVYAELKQTDIYNYWEKEEKKIVKVEDVNWKRVDPA